MTELATLDFSDRVATLTMNRPDTRNAMSLELLDALHGAMDRLNQENHGCHVLVITGAGRSFCAGMDLKAVVISQSGDPTLGATLLHRLAELTVRIRSLPLVTVASVNGAAVGGGCGLTCVCDLSVTHDDAKLGFPEVDLGLCPAVIAPWVVGKLGASVARRAMLMGGVMSGADAFEIGLVDARCECRDQLAATTAVITDRLSKGGPRAMQATKALLNQIDGSTNPEQTLAGARLSAEVLATNEAQRVLEARLSGR